MEKRKRTQARSVTSDIVRQTPYSPGTTPPNFFCAWFRCFIQIIEIIAITETPKNKPQSALTIDNARGGCGYKSARLWRWLLGRTHQFSRKSFNLF